MATAAADFPARAKAALADPVLQGALAKLQTEFRRDRAAMQERLPEFGALRDRATAIREHALSHLDELLETFEQRVTAAGGIVHWCRDADEARRTVTRLCRDAPANKPGPPKVVKSKSMLSEEIGLNDHLADAGIAPVETDLGEYILQLRREAPSHIVMPAIHLNAGQIGEVFRAAHTARDPARDLDDPDALLAEARALLRQAFLDADVGITGANFLIAETGSTWSRTKAMPISYTRCRQRTSPSSASRRSCRHWTMRWPSSGCWRARRQPRKLPPIRRW